VESVEFVDFEARFNEWLNRSLMEPIPKQVKALCFNLFEPSGESGVKFGIELIGAGRFDSNDPDWPCSEVWEPSTRRLPIPVSFSGEHWSECLEKVKELVLRQLNTESAGIRKLKQKKGIGIGFVDGGLDVVWQQSQTRRQ
jgi:shikimate kinase